MTVKPDWHDMSPAAKVALVRAIYEPGMSAGEIAAKLGDGVSRNAVIGIYTRNSQFAKECPLNGGNTVKAKKQTRPLKPHADIVGRPIKPLFKVIGDREMPDESLPDPPLPHAPVIRELPGTPQSRHLALTGLTERTCKWPYGDQDFTFCGAEKDIGGPYCRFHARLSYA